MLLGRVITISAVAKLAPLWRSRTRGIDDKLPATTCSSLLSATNERRWSEAEVIVEPFGECWPLSLAIANLTASIPRFS